MTNSYFDLVEAVEFAAGRSLGGEIRDKMLAVASDPDASARYFVEYIEGEVAGFVLSDDRREAVVEAFLAYRGAWGW